MLLHLSLSNIFPLINSTQLWLCSGANLFNFLDQAFDAFYDKSCVNSQDMTLNNLFFSPHFDADQRKIMLDIRQLWTNVCLLVSVDWVLGNMGLPPSQQTACCVFKIDQEWIIRIMIGKSQGTDHYLLSGWVHGCVRVGWGGGISPALRTSQITKL